MLMHWLSKLVGNSSLFGELPYPTLLSVQVDAKPLRAELVPVTAAALERIKLLLLNMARQVSTHGNPVTDR
jgi:hypothetical protein